jgi:agmatine/peptidylarginine deiminase
MGKRRRPIGWIHPVTIIRILPARARMAASTPASAVGTAVARALRPTLVPMLVTKIRAPDRLGARSHASAGAAAALVVLRLCLLPAGASPADADVSREFPGGRLPPEFASQHAIVLDGVDLPRSWPEVFIEIVLAVRGRADIVALIAGPEDRDAIQRLLDRRGLPRDLVLAAPVAHDTMWVRDFAPLSVRRHDGRDVLVDLDYGARDRPADDEVASRLAELLALPLDAMPLRIEGGNLLVNGEGLCLTTTVVLERNDGGESPERVCGALLTYLGCEQVVFLEPLHGEDTGHADMFAVFTSPRTVVLGAYEPEADPVNAALLERNAARLATVETRDGPLEVVRVPMPARGDGVWRTWTNVVFADGALLFPTYAGADAGDQRRARTVFAGLLPGWQLREIDSEPLAALGGGLHCVTMNMAAAGDTARLTARMERDAGRPGAGPAPRPAGPAGSGGVAPRSTRAGEVRSAGEHARAAHPHPRGPR